MLLFVIELRLSSSAVDWNTRDKLFVICIHIRYRIQFQPNDCYYYHAGIQTQIVSVLSDAPKWFVYVFKVAK